ncbi:3-oxoacyl-ACP reductase [Kocuria sp. HSID16901]|uniref:3-oxoacyl-ACP reductase n=1 Tax=Kocuria sp. HSID16901 TaxID=2419505 RepID=UPI000660D061|nr:3-oxoacyl-ACP reductase [Kocuria sp. HSID16901]MCT1366953.1 3-oxoacyl-ACP reductase [Rothia sp. p3-SID1597]RUQ20044.1 3-oxoacyl-ACP reductase [Kocuria sp. HSID16901]
MTETSETVRGTSIPLNEQVVVVTGGARGLGLAISRAFLREGARVVVGYHRSGDAAHRLAEEFPERARAVHLDVRDRERAFALPEEIRGLFSDDPTTLVNNALLDFSFNGDARPQAIDITPDVVQTQVDGSVMGPLAMIQALYPGMAQRGWGRIVNIGTNLFQNPVVPYHDYTAAKAALLSLTRTFSHDLGPDGITVNMVSGGLLRETDASSATPTEVFDAIAQSTPLRRVTTPEELADAVLFFASPWARAVTGQNLMVDGGLVKG